MKGVYQKTQDESHTTVCLLDDLYMLGTMLSTWGEMGERINMNDNSLPSRKIYRNNNLRMF